MIDPEIQNTQVLTSTFETNQEEVLTFMSLVFLKRIVFKGTVTVIVSDPPCKHGNTPRY